MSETKLDTISEHQLQTVQAWIKKFGRASVPVLVGPAPDPEETDENEEIVDEREVEFTHDSPWLSGKEGDLGRLAMIRVGVTYRPTELDTLEVHPRYAEYGSDKVKPIPTVDLDFPPPQCAYCEIDLQHDGDGWYCEQCAATWGNSGYSGHTRPCVEPECDGAPAELIGPDGQPRCRGCQFLISIDEIEPSAPYKCREIHCAQLVVGMPASAAARTQRRCGSHQQRVDEKIRWESFDREHGITTAAAL